MLSIVSTSCIGHFANQINKMLFLLLYIFFPQCMFFYGFFSSCKRNFFIVSVITTTKRRGECLYKVLHRHFFFFFFSCDERENIFDGLRTLSTVVETSSISASSSTKKINRKKSHVRSDCHESHAYA